MTFHNYSNMLQITFKHKCFYFPWIKTGSAVKQFNNKRIFISLTSNSGEEGNVKVSKRGKENPTEELIPY